jgi:hypothetical protein
MIQLFTDRRQQTWLPQAILDSDWSIFFKFFSSETAWPNKPKLDFLEINQSETRIACGGYVY